MEYEYEPARLVRDCQLLYCEDCEAVLWTVSHPYWKVGNVKWMHGRGCPGHKLTMWQLRKVEAS